MAKKINETLAWILGRGTRKDRYGVENMRYILEELQYPDREYVSVAIGGTNGKGSVTAICESIMSLSKIYSIGSLTSPHLLDLRERIKINKEPLLDKYWIQAVKELKGIYRTMDKEESLGTPAFFETVAAIGLWSFRELFCDLVFLEVGLGGRLDATNACEPEISVLTNIGTDHQEYLGVGKIAIAREKLGIIRKNRPLITSEKEPEVIEEIEKSCKTSGVKLVKAYEHKYFDLVESNAQGHTILVNDSDEPVFMPLPGSHQLQNLQTALCLIDQLRKHGFEIVPDAIREGLAKVFWPGRLEWISQSPPVLLDSAHNAEGAEALIKYIKDYLSDTPVAIVFGALKDKPLAEMADGFAEISEELVYYAPASPRALSRENFRDYLGDCASSWSWGENFEDMIDRLSQKNMTIIITGSIYLVSEAMKHFSQDNNR